MSEQYIIGVTAMTHQGAVRSENEDSIAVGAWVRNKPMRMPHQWRFALEEEVCCVVADGMGGHAAGEVASQHVAQRLSQAVAGCGDAAAIQSLLLQINAELYEQMKADSSRIGMGSTVVGLLFKENSLFWFNIGDSRLYQHRNGFLRQISIDDVPPAANSSDPQAQRKSGAITQSMGGTSSMQMPVPHIGEVELTAPGRWLLCSDGLTDMLDIDKMEECLGGDDLGAVTKLFSAAMEAGAEDNISIIIVAVEKAS